MIKYMKKNDCREFFYPWGKVKKWLFLMKLIAFFLFAGLCQVSATAFGQRETVTFSRDAMTLEEIFTTIRKQLQYDIFYSNFVTVQYPHSYVISLDFQKPKRFRLLRGC